MLLFVMETIYRSLTWVGNNNFFGKICYIYNFNFYKTNLRTLRGSTIDK